MMKAIMCAVTLVLAAVSMSGCSDGNNRDANTEHHASIASFKPTVSTPIDPTLKSLELKFAAEELPENSETNVSVIATYIDGEESPPKTDVVWHSSDEKIIAIINGRLHAKAEGTVAVWAEAGGKLSPEKNITVYKVIHGHRLPPEPDPQLNNSTLLGIDSNNNGVRDDVERHIYLGGTYEHPVVRAVALQAARAFQIVIADASKARNTFKSLKAAMDCESYFKIYASIFDEPLLISRKRWIIGEIESLQMNTEQRRVQYRKFNGFLSGKVLAATSDNALKNQCDFDINKLLAK